MKRIILIFILPVVVFAAIAYSTFWYIKSGEIKKNITKLIESSPNSSIGSIQASGFPFSHKIVINEVNFEITTGMPIGDKSLIVIEQIAAQSSVFGNDFDAKIIGNISVTNAQNQTNLVTFNSAPSIKLFVKGFKAERISYSDSGYKILDETRKVIFSVGNSTVDLTMRGDEVLVTNLKAHFNNISNFDITAFEDKFATLTDQMGATRSIENKDIPLENLGAAENVGAPTTVNAVNPNGTPAVAPVVATTTATTTTTTTTQEVKPNGSVPALPVVDGTQPAENPVPSVAVAPENVTVEDTYRSLNVDLTFRSSKNVITDITVGSFEIISPLYKINAKGSINSFNTANPNVNLNLQVQNLDNILVYLRQYIADFSPSLDLNAANVAVAPAEAVVAVENPAVTTPANVTTTTTTTSTKTAVTEASKTAVSEKVKTTQTVTKEVPGQAPTVIAESSAIIVKPDFGSIVVSTISDLSKKNPNTNDTTAEFDIVSRENSLFINDENLEQIIFGILVNFSTSDGSTPSPVILENGAAAPVAPVISPIPAPAVPQVVAPVALPVIKNGKVVQPVVKPIPSVTPPTIAPAPVPTAAPAPTTSTAPVVPAVPTPAAPAVPVNGNKKKEMDFGNTSSKSTTTTTTTTTSSKASPLQ